MQPTSIESPSSFFDLALHEQLLKAVDKIGYKAPTPVQCQSIPSILADKDLLVSAETGSGKTAAFLLPTIHHLIERPSNKIGLRVLILAPTRELAQQTFGQCQQFSQFSDVTSALITGGEDFKKQQTQLRKNPEIVVATPGRFLELLVQESAVVRNLEVLILDEADRMLDMGFSEDVLSIVDQCNKQRQTLLFSATLTHYGVIKMADKVLKNHKTIALNTLHDGHDNIKQQMILADDYAHKSKLLAWLLLNETYDKALIFTNTRIKADELRGPLRGERLRVGVLHGDMDQKDRNRMMELFRDGTVNIVVATDLAARGLDVKGINLVINYDVPRNGIDYIHRIGRTGRADETGLTVALVNSTEWNIISGIARFLKQQFERRIIKGLESRYNGPKKVKASGKSAIAKKKEEPKKVPAKKVKVRERDKKNIGKRRVPSNKAPVSEVLE
ncbi:MAG: DEAD/DEAH box helicase [Methylococcales bacterium]|nr:DEAD/DEAH box helicase [Methylococcaceae bacterium]